MGIDTTQFIDYVVKPALKQTDLYTRASEQLVVSTIAHESSMATYLHQVGRGPALGPPQIEPNTFYSMHKDFISYKPDLEAKILRACNFSKWPAIEELITNLKFSAIMCRVRYLWVPHPLPDFGDINAQANYWAKYYNANPITGLPARYIESYTKFVAHYYEK